MTVGCLFVSGSMGVVGCSYGLEWKNWLNIGDYSSKPSEGAQILYLHSWSNVCKALGGGLYRSRTPHEPTEEGCRPGLSLGVTRD
jgi:hypothetical protein